MVDTNRLARTIDVLARREEDDVRLSAFVAGYFLVQAINLTVKSIFPIPKEAWSPVSGGFALCLAIWLGATIRPMMKRAFSLFLWLETIWLSLYLVSYWMGNSDAAFLLENAFWTLGVCIPVSVCACAVRDKGILYRIMEKYSYVVTALMSIVFLFPVDNTEYNMTFSYLLLLPTLFHINEWLGSFRARYLLLSIVEVIEILLLGSRGPVFCIGVMLVLKYLLSTRKTTKAIVLGIGGVVLVVVFYIFFEEIGTAVMSFLETRGYYSRTLYLAFQGHIADDSGRLSLYSHYLKMVEQKPLLGWGLVGGWIGRGWGPHNSLIALLLAFGCFFGGLACLMSIGLLLRVLFIKRSPAQDLLIILTSYSSAFYLVSGTFHVDPLFFIFMMLNLTSTRWFDLRRSLF